MIPKFLVQSKLTQKPGVYIFKDSLGQVLYVGKAIDLYHRVSSYFHKSYLKSADSKTKILVGKIAKVETVVVESELEALILEANFIKKYLPPFNVKLIDDKDYLYIALTREAFPKIVTVRKKDIQSVKRYWGPFPSSKTVRETLKSLRKVFPWCSNIPNIHTRCVNSNSHRVWKHKACFYYHLGLCPGVCAGVISQKDYNKIINNFSKFMDGKKDQLVSKLKKEMIQASNQQRYEEASKIKKTLEGISYLTQTERTRLYLENPNFLNQERELALKQLQNDLGLKKLPERIEGYDISNIQGKDATGSMVILTNGEIDKSQYRKFKIRISGRSNDVGMLREMIKRRFKHPEWPMPDLIIVDGGRGQVRAAMSTIQQFNPLRKRSEASNLTIPVFGLAKKMEWLYLPEGEIIRLPKRSLSLRLLQKLRDEAHRFAISYHRKLHGKMLFA